VARCFLARCAMATLYEGCRLRWHRQSCLRVLYSRTPDRADFETALRNTWRILIPGGTLRLIMPDLETGAVAYLRRLRNGMLDANDHFMDGIGERRPRNFLTHMRSFFGHGRHYWLWDFASTKTALERSGFQKIRRCKYGDNPDPMFGRVENKDRFVWAVSVECVK